MTPGIFDDRENLGNVHAAIEAGKKLAAPTMLQANPYVKLLVTAEGFEVQTVEADPKPEYIQQRVTFQDAASFALYFNDFKTAASRIFVDLKQQAFRAVLDYHQADAADRRKHVAGFACPKTVEWAAWAANDRQAKTQTQFAQFIEDNLPDIVEPAGAVLLEVARTLQGKKDAKFLQGVRLDNGQTQFRYEEEISAGAGQQGQLTIPETFVLGIRPFEGSDAYRMEARFRWRIKEGALTMWYELVRPHKVLEDALKAAVAQIQQATGTTVLAGVVEE